MTTLRQWLPRLHIQLLEAAVPLGESIYKNNVEVLLVIKNILPVCGYSCEDWGVTMLCLA